MRYRSAISHAIFHMSYMISQYDIACDKKRYRILGISHAISQCDIACDKLLYRIDIQDIAHAISMRYKKISHAISQRCDIFFIACDIALGNNPDALLSAQF